MKKSFIILFNVVSCFVLNGQDPYYNVYSLDFETYSPRIFIDTITNNNNIWQIGVPEKGCFSSAYEGTNAIVTDLENYYPVNDTSSFLIKHIPQGGYLLPHHVSLAGYYKVDSDSLNDYGNIEVSPDNGQTWIGLLSDSVSDFISRNEFVLTGKSDWNLFLIYLSAISEYYEIGDTVLYKFSFVSDDIPDNRMGLMFDNLMFDDIGEGIQSFKGGIFGSMVWPNPAKEHIQIHFDNNEGYSHELVIFDTSGSIVSRSISTSDLIQVPTGTMKSGIYYYKLINKENWLSTTGKFVLID